jgi:hypothetical protein
MISGLRWYGVLDLREGMGFPLAVQARGKLEIVWSPVDETPIFTTGGIFKDAPHPNAAKLYLTWFLARGSGAALARSRRASTCRRLKASSRSRLIYYKTANNYREFMIDDKLVADLRKRFEATPARRLTRAV